MVIWAGKGLQRRDDRRERRQEQEGILRAERLLCDNVGDHGKEDRRRERRRAKEEKGSTNGREKVYLWNSE